MADRPLPELVYRGLARRWKEGDSVSLNAFRRGPNDRTGLSIGFAEAVLPEFYRGTKGCATIRIAHLLSLGLSVIADDDRHGNIVGLPPFVTEAEDPEGYGKAEQFADLIRSRLVSVKWY